MVTLENQHLPRIGSLFVWFQVFHKISTHVVANYKQRVFSMRLWDFQTVLDFLLILFFIFIFRWKSWVRLQGHLVRIEQCQIPPRVQWIRPQKKQAWPRSPRRPQPQPLQPQLIPLGGVQKQHWQQIFVRFKPPSTYLKLW